MFRSVFVAAVTVLAANAFAVTPVAADPRLNLPASCAAIHATVPVAGDGNYVLRAGTRIVPVYCHDMAGVPREYVTLNAANFSQYTAGGAARGTNVRTTFMKVRIKPETLTIDINDLTFAMSTGRLRHGLAIVTRMPYAAAMSCDHRPSGVGRVDLTGTAFVLADTFVRGGFRPVSRVVGSPDRRFAHLAGGGYCGWVTPAPVMYNPMNPTGSDFHLELACAPYTFVDVVMLRACIDLA